MGSRGFRKKESFQPDSGFQSKKEGGLDNGFQDGGVRGTKKGPSFLSGGSGLRSRRATPLITLAVLFACCVIALCLVGVYLVYTGVVQMPSFG
jgi:hypothetical protein